MDIEKEIYFFCYNFACYVRFRASLAGLLQGLQLRLLQELCQTPVLERALHGEPVKSRSHFLPTQERPQKRASRSSLLWVHVV